VLSDDAFGLLIAGGRTAVLPVRAGDASMAPLLRGGDAVAASAGGPRARGDLLVFLQQDYLVVHRYLGPARTRDGRDCLRTRGDGRNALDPPLEPGRVRARVVAVRRGGRWTSLGGPGAALFRTLMAWHGLFWSAAGVLARPVGLGGLAAVLDRGVLALAVPLVFPLLHRAAAPPVSEGPAKPD
jgi:hypothetical protein